MTTKSAWNKTIQQKIIFVYTIVSNFFLVLFVKTFWRNIFLTYRIDGHWWMLFNDTFCWNIFWWHFLWVIFLSKFVWVLFACWRISIGTFSWHYLWKFPTKSVNKKKYPQKYFNQNINVPTKNSHKKFHKNVPTKITHKNCSEKGDNTKCIEQKKIQEKNIFVRTLCEKFFVRTF